MLAETANLRAETANLRAETANLLKRIADLEKASGGGNDGELADQAPPG